MNNGDNIIINIPPLTEEEEKNWLKWQKIFLKMQKLVLET